ncbi:MAG: hypothetical protein ACKV22_21985 [Bryobacteraceae bacterium]
MAKFKAPKPKQPSLTGRQGAPCLVLLIGGMLLLLLLVYLSMRSS